MVESTRTSVFETASVAATSAESAERTATEADATRALAERGGRSADGFRGNRAAGRLVT